MTDTNNRTGLAGFLASERLARLRWMRFLLAPVLAAGATGVHFALNVPNRIQHSSHDQGAPARLPNRPKNGKKRDHATHAPRSQKKLDRLWAQHGAQPFADEPVDTAWARGFQAHVNKAVVVARDRAFKGAPEAPQVLLASSECHTIRCQFTLRGPFPHEVALLAETLETLRYGDGDLWRDFQSEAVDPGPQGAKDQHLVLITVAFAADEVDSSQIVAPTADSAPDAPEPAKAGEAVAERGK